MTWADCGDWNRFHLLHTAAVLIHFCGEIGWLCQAQYANFSIFHKSHLTFCIKFKDVLQQLGKVWRMKKKVVLQFSCCCIFSAGFPLFFFWFVTPVYHSFWASGSACLFIIRCQTLRWETLCDCCAKMFRQGRILQTLPSGRPHLTVYIFMRSNWYFGLWDLHQHEDILRWWQIGTRPRAHTPRHTHTHTHAPVTVLESTKGDDPRASSGPRRSIVWQICITLHFLHNSPYYGSKWPAWSPWISMSRVSGCVNSACMSLALLGWRRRTRRERKMHKSDIAGWGIYVTLKSNVYVTLRDVIEIGGSLRSKRAPSRSKATLSPSFAGKIMVILTSCTIITGILF